MSRYRWLNGWMFIRRGGVGWLNGWMVRWLDGWMDGWMVKMVGWLDG